MDNSYIAPKKGKGKGKPSPADQKAAPPPKPRKPLPPPACFNQEQIAQFKELFKAHDETGTDKIMLPMVPLCLRKLGLNPSQGQMKELFATFLEDDMVDMVEFWEFLLMVERKIQMGDDIEKVVVDSMKNLSHDDEEIGFVNLEFLKEQLMTWGEPLSEIEFADWYRMAKRDKTYNEEDGTFRYEKFVENMNAGDKRFFPEPINYFKLDQHALMKLALEKAAEEKAEQERLEADKRAKEEAKRQRMIEAGLIME